MVEKIRTGNEYLLDEKTVVKVLKSLNRSNTMFCVETSDHNILTVEKSRLKLNGLNPSLPGETASS